MIITKEDVSEFMELKQQVGSLRSGRPLYNESFFPDTQGIFQHDIASLRELMKIIKRSPEALGILKALVTDVLHDFHFEGRSKNRKQNKANVKRAQEFAMVNMFESELTAFAYDFFGLGDGYLWHGVPKPSLEEVKERGAEILSNINKNTGIEVKEGTFDWDLVYKQMFDEDDNSKAIEHVPATTVNINHNQFKVLNFVQIVNSAKDVVLNSDIINLTGNVPSPFVQRSNIGQSNRIWTPEEIIHAKYIDIDGKIHGFSPMRALLPVLSTLELVKDYTGTFFQNGGVMDWMFVLPKEMAGNPNVLALRQTLQKYRNSTNKHGSLVFTGEVTPIQLNRFDKDMEFRQLAIYYTGLIALAYNMPSDRIQSIVIDKKDEGSDLNDSAYWRGLVKTQKYFANLLNGQFFNKEFDVNIVFDTPFVQDEIRKTQELIQKISAAKDLKSMNLATDEAIFNMLGIKEKDRPDGPIKDVAAEMQKNFQSPDNQTKPNMRDKKKQEQEKTEESRQMPNPGL